MKKWHKTLIIVISVSAVLGLIGVTWNFDKSFSCEYKYNPFWNANLDPLESSLIEDLEKENFRFYKDRGNEVGKGGVCFGYFASDEYWILRYDDDSKKVNFEAWIIGINLLGHISADRKFERIKNIIENYSK